MPAREVLTHRRQVKTKEENANGSSSGQVRWKLILPGNTQAWNVPKNMGTEGHGEEEAWACIRQIWENVTSRVSLSLPEVCVLPNTQCVFHGFSENSHLDFL